MVIGKRAFAGVILTTLLFAAVCWADITGTISGVVTDSSGAVVSGANVVATNTQTGVEKSVTTDSKGFYVIPALAVGDYNLRIRLDGFKTYEKIGVRVDANSAIRSDVALEVGTISEKIDVSSDAV